LVLVAALVVFGAFVVRAQVDGATRGPLSPLRQRIVSIALSQVGYRTEPATTYCNRYSAYWGVGAEDCGNANRNEPWCADFAAWVWRAAGAQVDYGYARDDLNAASASFYAWGVAHGVWHPVGSGYEPQPGDVAVYGLEASGTAAQHVAVVTAVDPGHAGPDVVNGDGSRQGFSVVETGTDQVRADIHGDGGQLAGYVAPISVRPSAT
jgi:CHAP domain